MINPTAALLTDIERFLRKSGMAATSFGFQALGDPSLVNNLKNGRELRHRTLVRVRAFMAEAKAKATTHDRPRQSA